MDTTYTYLFGPVPSRRFGMSLGVDLTPYKTCSINCVFCQLGPTTATTLERKEYVPTEAVCNELDTWLHTQGTANYITLSGSGEPTLHERFGDILAWINASTTIPSVLLTNGTLLWLPEVRAAASRAAIVKLSLSVWDQAAIPTTVQRPGMAGNCAPEWHKRHAHRCCQNRTPGENPATRLHSPQYGCPTASRKLCRAGHGRTPERAGRIVRAYSNGRG